MLTNIPRPSFCWGFDRRVTTATTTITSVDRGYTVDATSGTYDVALTAAATLGSGFVCAVYNSGSGTVTVNPNASETILTPSGAVTTIALTQGQGLLLQCTGTGFEASAAVGMFGGSVISGLTAGRIVTAASATTIATPVGITSTNLIDWANPVSVTTGTTITSTGAGKVHLCTGTSADYTVNLPTSGITAGDLIAFQMGTTSTLTKLVTLDATSGKAIDGSQTRIMWSNEVAVLKWDGTNWCKIGGKSIAMVGSLQMNGANQSLNDSTPTKINLDTIVADIGGISDTANHRITIRRAGNYVVFVQVYFAVSTAVTRAIVYCVKNGSPTIVQSEAASSSAYAAVPKAGPLPAALAAADYVETFGYQATGGAYNALGGGAYCLLSASEILSW